jgi:hypothetical protein
MDHSIRFEIDRTRYLVWRQGLWAFEMIVTSIKDGVVNVLLIIPYREQTVIARHKCLSLTSEEGVGLQMEWPDGGHDDVVMVIESLGDSHVVLGLDLPQGVDLKPMPNAADEGGN